MCGIAGIFSKAPLPAPLCMDFIDTLFHRGPDGRGVHFDCNETLFLGHRRLKILDLTDAGKQPMHSPDGRYSIVFNGEIYNFLELKAELFQKGYSFHSQSDTEVILAAYREWGEACQLKFNGMWAFVIWDSQEKELFLSRDRFGVKPLYIYQNAQQFAFASEIKAFASLFNLECDEQKVADTIEDPLHLEPTSETLFKNIKKIPAGHSARFSWHHPFVLTRWWDTLSHLPTIPSTHQERSDAFRHLFFDACAIRMRSDVPIGTALSGGLDSSSILSTIFSLGQNSQTRWPTSWQKSFTAVFPNSSHDEGEFAKIAAEHTKAESHFFPINADQTIKHLEECLYTIEDIFDPPIGPWLLYREYRKQNVTISIDGHGADELLCGYHHQFERAILESIFPFPRVSRLQTLWPVMKQMYAMPNDRNSLILLKKLLKTGAQSLFANKQSPLYQLIKQIYWQPTSTGHGRHGWLKIKPSPAPLVLSNEKAFNELSLLNRLLYLDFHHLTLPSILRNFDRCSMAHGVEIRAPFMDFRIATYAFSLPSKEKAGALGSKQILRTAMKGILPEPIRLRTSKIGFASPVNQWISGPLRPYILDSLSSIRFQQSSIWDGPKIFQEASTSKEPLFLRKAWEFFLADQLMAKFKQHRKKESCVLS